MVQHTKHLPHMSVPCFPAARVAGGDGTPKKKGLVRDAGASVRPQVRGLFN